LDGNKPGLGEQGSRWSSTTTKQNSPEGKKTLKESSNHQGNNSWQPTLKEGPPRVKSQGNNYYLEGRPPQINSLRVAPSRKQISGQIINTIKEM
jgi:hypothetical protein